MRKLCHSRTPIAYLEGMIEFVKPPSGNHDNTSWVGKNHPYTVKLAPKGLMSNKSFDEYQVMCLPSSEGTYRIVCWELNPQCGHIERWGPLGGVSVTDLCFHEWTNASTQGFEVDTPSFTPCPDSFCRRTQRAPRVFTEISKQQPSQHARVLILDFPPSRRVRNFPSL